MKNIIMYKQGENSYVNWILKRIRKNLNFISIAEGPTGIGKSWAMLSFAYKLDKDFSINQVGFGFREVMDIINAPWFKCKRVKIILFDEAQVDIGNRQWQSLINKLFNYLMSTFRHQNIIFLMTSPYSDFIDSATMKLVHCKFEVKGHSEKTNKTLVRPKLLQYNSNKKMFYNHSLFVLRDGILNKLKQFYISKPPEHLIEEYEDKKKEFTDLLNQKILSQLQGVDNKDKKVLTEFQKQIMELIGKGLTPKQIAEETGKNVAQIYDNMGFIRRKGWEIKK